MKSTLLALALSAASFALFAVAARSPPEPITIYCLSENAKPRALADGSACSVGGSIAVALHPPRRAIVGIGAQSGRELRTRAGDDGVAMETLPLAATERGRMRVRVFAADGNGEVWRTVTIDVVDGSVR